MKLSKDYKQLLVIMIGVVIAYMLIDPNPGESFDIDMLLAIAIPSVIVVGILLLLTYLLQNYLAKSMNSFIEYEYWPWSIFASVVVTVLSIGAIPFYMPGIFRAEKKHGGLGRRLPEHSRVESAALAGIGPTLGLIFAMIFINDEFVATAAVGYTIWSMLLIPKTNGFHFFNWHPLHGFFTTILGLTLLFGYVINSDPITSFVFIIAAVFIPYQWLYVFVLAKRTGYK